MPSQKTNNDLLVKGICRLAGELDLIRKSNPEDKHFAEMLYARIDTLYKAAQSNMNWFDILSQE